MTPSPAKHRGKQHDCVCYSLRSPTGGRYQATPPSWHSGECRYSHSQFLFSRFCFFVFFKNLCLTEIRWKGNVAGFLHLAQISYCLSLCGALSTMCQTPRCFEFKKKKDEEGEKYPMKMKLWQGDKSHHCFSSVLLEDRSRRGGRKRKMKITRVKGEKVRMESKTETTRVGRGMQEGQRPASLPISPSQPLMLPR